MMPSSGGRDADLGGGLRERGADAGDLVQRLTIGTRTASRVPRPPAGSP